MWGVTGSRLPTASCTAVRILRLVLLPATSCTFFLPSFFSVLRFVTCPVLTTSVPGPTPYAISFADLAYFLRARYALFVLTSRTSYARTDRRVPPTRSPVLTVAYRLPGESIEVAEYLPPALKAEIEEDNRKLREVPPFLCAVPYVWGCFQVFWGPFSAALPLFLGALPLFSSAAPLFPQAVPPKTEALTRAEQELVAWDDKATVEKFSRELAKSLVRTPLPYHATPYPL